VGLPEIRAFEFKGKLTIVNPQRRMGCTALVPGYSFTPHLNVSYFSFFRDHDIQNHRPTGDGAKWFRDFINGYGFCRLEVRVFCNVTCAQGERLGAQQNTNRYGSEQSPHG
jgi:hypothetical protein